MPELRSLAFAMLFAVVLLLTWTTILTGFQNEYSSNISEGNRTMNLTDIGNRTAIMNQVALMNNKTAEFTISVGSGDMLGIVFAGTSWAFETAKTTINFVMLYIPLISSIALNLLTIGTGFFGEYINILSAFITIVVVFELISMVMKYKT